MKAFRDAIFSVAATASKAIGGLISIKIIAEYCGPEGLGLLGNLFSAIAIVSILGSGGISIGVTKYAAIYRRNEIDLRRLLKTALILCVVTCIPICLGIILFSTQVSMFLFGVDTYSRALAISAPLILLTACSTIGISFLNGKGALQELALIQFITAALGCAVLFVLTRSFLNYGAIIGTLLLSGLPIVGIIFLFYQSKWFHYNTIDLALDQAVLRQLLPYSLPLAVNVITQNIGFFIIREWIGEQHGLNQVGYWQAMSRISDAYLQVFYVFLAGSILPKLSAENKLSDQISIVMQSYKVMVPALIGFLLIVWVAKDPIVAIALSREFYPTKNLFSMQLVGDLFKILAFLPGYILLARGSWKPLLFPDILQMAIYLSLCLPFIAKNGALGACQAYSITYIIYFIISLAVVLFLRFKKS